jgi:uncharacterized protein (TIGR03067 family)
MSLAEGTATATSRALLKPLAALLVGLGVFAAAGLAMYQPAATAPPAAPAPHGVSGAPLPTVADRERLQGEWRVVSSEMNGVKDFDIGKGHDLLVLSGDRVTYWMPKKVWEGRLRLDNSRTPSEIDIEFDGGTTLRGIYEFDGARLRLCWTKGGRRPTSFDTAAGELLTFLYEYEKKP